jgi:hypothetical protein
MRTKEQKMNKKGKAAKKILVVGWNLMMFLKRGGKKKRNRSCSILSILALFLPNRDRVQYRGEREWCWNLFRQIEGAFLMI